MSACVQVERAVQRHLEWAEYRFDVAIAELRSEPRPETVEQRRAREAREGMEAVGRAYGLLARGLAQAADAFAAGFRSAFGGQL